LTPPYANKIWTGETKLKDMALKNPFKKKEEKPTKGINPDDYADQTEYLEAKKKEEK